MGGTGSKVVECVGCVGCVGWRCKVDILCESRMLADACRRGRGLGEGGGKSSRELITHLEPSLDIQNSADIKNNEFAYYGELSRRALVGNVFSRGMRM